MAGRREHRSGTAASAARSDARERGSPVRLNDAVVLVQARTGSRRLPGKVLASIGDRPMVLHVLERAALIGPPVILATTTGAEDDDLASVVERAGYTVRRGSRDDVLDRFVAALPAEAHYAVRVTADCPFFDPAIGRIVLAALVAGEVDYVSNTSPPTYPDGLDCWAFTVDALRRAWREATLPSDREHVLPYIWRNPDRFRVRNLAHVPDLSAERWTVDDERDLAFAREIDRRTAAMPVAERLRMETILAVLDAEPGLREMNRGAQRDEGYRLSRQSDAIRDVRIDRTDSTENERSYAVREGQRALGKIHVIQEGTVTRLRAELSEEAWSSGAAAAAVREVRTQLQSEAPARPIRTSSSGSAERQRAFERAGFRPLGDGAELEALPD